jgi:hypothetical protein
MKQLDFFEDMTKQAIVTKNSLLKRYEGWLLRFGPFRRLVAYLHRRLNRVQYDPVNPQNRTSTNPEGYQTQEEQALARSIERDKNLLDKVESYFRLRPVSTSILAFFVISAAATSAKGQPYKIAVAIVIILAILPLLLSKQDEVINDEQYSSVVD